MWFNTVINAGMDPPQLTLHCFIQRWLIFSLKRLIIDSHHRLWDWDIIDPDELFYRHWVKSDWRMDVFSRLRLFIFLGMLWWFFNLNYKHYLCYITLFLSYIIGKLYSVSAPAVKSEHLFILLKSVISPRELILAELLHSYMIYNWKFMLCSGMMWITNDCNSPCDLCHASICFLGT